MEERSKSHIKNKEVRQLRKNILDHFSRLSSDQVSTLLVEKGNVSLAKLISKTVVYSVDNVPYFVDIQARNNLLPTIFILFQYPTMLRSFVVHSPVSEYLLNGADLMTPGVHHIEGQISLIISFLVITYRYGDPTCW